MVVATLAVLAVSSAGVDTPSGLSSLARLQAIAVFTRRNRTGAGLGSAGALTRQGDARAGPGVRLHRAFAKPITASCA